MIRGVIFDLDGVLLSTDEFHFQAWQELASRESIYFDRTINERLRGVSRMESLEIILEQAKRSYTNAEKEEMANFKNDRYKELLTRLGSSDVYPGVIELIDFLQTRNVRIAIGSSSKNTKYILERTGLAAHFAGAVSDGTNISRSKPDPEVFLKAAAMINTVTADCLVVEDAEAGIIAAKAAGMTAVGVGSAKGHPLADFSVNETAGVRTVMATLFA